MTATAGGPGTPAGPSTLNYTLLEQIPGSNRWQGDLPSYLQNLYKFTFWAIGIAALFMLSVGGFLYVTSAGNTSRMGTAKEIIFDSLLGLALALVAWLFLYIINPDFVKINLPTITVTAPPSPTPGAPIPPGAAWPSDATERGQLASGVSVNRPTSCTTFGQSACTSLAGSAAIPAINALKSACNCSFVVSGGTECWLHGSKDSSCAGTHHKPGGFGIDLAHNPALDKYIQDTAGAPMCSPSGRPLYRIGSAVFWNEDSAHWHVNFNWGSCSGF